jgi:hypothetical protein
MFCQRANLSKSLHFEGQGSYYLSQIVHFEGQKATLAFQFQGLLSVAILSFEQALSFFHLLALWPGERKSGCQVFGSLLMAHSSYNSCPSPSA